MDSPTAPSQPAPSQCEASPICLAADYFFMCLYFVARLLIVPISWPLNLVLWVVASARKIAKLGVTFLVAGIQGVQRALRIGAFAQRIHYAVLKENGQYLKLPNKTLEEVFTCQLYDYSVRKFMSVSQIPKDSKITEIQFWASSGLNFLGEWLKVKHVTALSNQPDKINKYRLKMKDVHTSQSDYASDTSPTCQDIFLFFNRSREHEQHKVQVDLIRILGYIKKNMAESGYAVIGNYFNYDGDIEVFESLLDGFGFRVEMKDDITPNLAHSRRVLSRIHRGRKLAWAIGRAKQALMAAVEHHNIFCDSMRYAWKKLKQFAGVKSSHYKYLLFIVEHAE